MYHPIGVYALLFLILGQFDSKSIAQEDVTILKGMERMHIQHRTIRGMTDNEICRRHQLWNLTKVTTDNIPMGVLLRSFTQFPVLPGYLKFLIIGPCVVQAFRTLWYRKSKAD